MIAQAQTRSARELSNLQPQRLNPGGECPLESAVSNQDEYFRFVKPGLESYLQLLGLNVTYHRGQADRLYYTGHDGQAVVAHFGRPLCPARAIRGDKAELDSNGFHIVSPHQMFLLHTAVEASLEKDASMDHVAKRGLGNPLRSVSILPNLALDA